MKNHKWLPLALGFLLLSLVLGGCGLSVVSGSTELVHTQRASLSGVRQLEISCAADRVTFYTHETADEIYIANCKCKLDTR